MPSRQCLCAARRESRSLSAIAGSRWLASFRAIYKGRSQLATGGLFEFAVLVGDFLHVSPLNHLLSFCQKSTMWSELLQITVVALVVAFIATLVAMLSRRQRYMEYHMEKPAKLDDEQFVRSLAGMIQLRLHEGNRIDLLKDGEDAFPAMFEAVENAQQSITFESYIYWSGEIGHQFADLLAKKAQQGVKVHVIVDWLGAKAMDRRSLRRMKRAGVEVHQYHPPQFGLLHHLNNRTHRRELVIDGRIGFTGGVGFGDQWTSDDRGGESYRDNHYRIEGPVVADLQAVFLDNWLTTSGDVLHGERYFPELRPEGSLRGGILASEPQERTTWARLAILMLIHAAQESIYVEQPYFVPDSAILSAFAKAAERGVQVQLLLSGEKIDFNLVRRASRCLWGQLLEAGVEIHEYQPTMLHSKVMVVDSFWSLLGSVNFDYRSLYRNDETVLLVRDREFARQHIEVCNEDRKDCLPISLEQWKQRPWTEKLADRTVGLFKSQL